MKLRFWSLHIKSQFNLTKNLETPDVLKKGVWKFNIVLWLQLNSYSKCLMSASTALQTSLKHTFSEEICKHISH